MKKSEAYWILSELKQECFSSKVAEALDMAMELLESEDLLTEAFDKGELVRKID